MNRFFRWLFRRSDEAASPKVEADAAVTPRKGGIYPPLSLSLLLGSGGPMSIGAVYSCVKLISDSVASLPLRVMKQKDGIFVPDETSRLHYLLTVQPNEATSAFDFWARAIQDVLTEGNAYIVPIWNPVTMDLDRLVLADPTTVEHDTYNDTYTFSDIRNGLSGTYGEDEVIHIKSLTLNDPKHGVSVLTFARVTLGIASTGDNETLNSFSNGGDVRGILTNNTTAVGFGEYTDDQLQYAAADVDSRFRSGERIVSLPGDVGFKQISLSSADMQFLESRKFAVTDICRFFRVPPSFVFADTSNNYKSVEMANVAFLSNCLNPLLRCIEAEMLRKLFAPSLCLKRRIEFDREQLYATDLESRVKYQSSTIAAGIYTLNEWRKKENRPPVPGGDTVLVSANLKTITQLLNEGSATTDNDEREPDDTTRAEPVRRPTHS